ncbi:hypothetical protein ACIQCJ_35510 [Streptomyces sp. NPDC093221]|uniref:hypothetical protein n=1 Tax=Streptomyces sp. NPDC093221 TaxID=3366032 RepID=UPI003823E9A6
MARVVGDLPLFDESTSRFVQHLLDEGFLEWDSEMLFIGPEAEKQFGRHHFMGITAVFCAPPQFRVISGRADIGLVEVGMLVEEVPGPRLILLTGRTCRVTHIDWRRQRCFAEAYDGSGGRARWTGRGAVPSFAMCRARRDVILGADPPVRLTARGKEVPDYHPRGSGTRRPGWQHRRSPRRRRHCTLVDLGRPPGYVVLAASLPQYADPEQQVGDYWLRLRQDLPSTTRDRLVSESLDPDGPRVLLRPPVIDIKALDGLKFNEVLPPDLVAATPAERIADADGALAALREPMTWINSSPS